MGMDLEKNGFEVVIKRDEDGFLIATITCLKSCYTQARTLEELLPRIKEVIDLCLQEEEPGSSSSNRCKIESLPRKPKT